MPDWDAKIRQGLTHASLLSLATAFGPDHTAKLPAPAASMTMPAKHSASKLIPWRIRLAKRHPGIARAVPKSIWPCVARPTTFQIVLSVAAPASAQRFQLLSSASVFSPVRIRN